MSKKNELRIYVNGEKQFCKFDWDKFVAYLVANPPTGQAVNGTLHLALNAATGSITEDGKTFSYATVEW